MESLNFQISLLIYLVVSAVLALVLIEAGLHPSFIIGGDVNEIGSGSAWGTGDLFVVEADESDGTFLKLKSTCAVVTNIDPEHLDHYGSFDKVRDAFRQFVENVPFYGFAVMCMDHPEVQSLIGRIEDRLGALHQLADGLAKLERTRRRHEAASGARTRSLTVVSVSSAPGMHGATFSTSNR